MGVHIQHSNTFRCVVDYSKLSMLGTEIKISKAAIKVETFKITCKYTCTVCCNRY